jgi:MYXO-CTERM domain-containing protein
MGNGKGPLGFRALAVALLVAAPATVYAHARLTTPPPRNNNSGIKVGPCGGIPRTTAFQQYQPGQQVTVLWDETIEHGGCYDVVFSPANDTNWVRLQRFPDPLDAAPGTNYGANPRKFSGTVTMPSTPCVACTLALRQIMNTGDLPCQPQTQDQMDGGPPTYFSCADIRIGDFQDAAPSLPFDGGIEDPDVDDGGPDPGHPSNPNSPRGGAGNLRAGAGDDGCSISWGPASGIPAVIGLGLAALAFVRRRRRS